MNFLPDSLLAQFRQQNVDWCVSDEKVLTLLSTTTGSVRRCVRATCEEFKGAAAIRVARDKATVQLP